MNSGVRLMGTGVIVCGLNGAGKSTLGRALAERLRFHFIDNENLYFPKTDPSYLYATPRTRDEVKRLLLNEIREHGNFVFASVKGDYGEDVYPLFRCAVWVDVPRNLRMERVRNRSFQKFGNRMLPGGDLYEQEERFFEFVAARDEDTVERWLRDIRCPVIRVDGTKPIEENVAYIVGKIVK